MAAPENIDKVEPEEISIVTRPEKVRMLDLTSFKAHKELFSITKPFINILPKGAKSKL